MRTGTASTIRSSLSMGDPRILGTAVSSRVFPLIPPPAVKRYLSIEFGVRRPNPSEGGCSSAIGLTAKLVGLIKHVKQRRPADKPVVASIQDGLTSNVAHLAVLCLSAESFYFDCKVKTEGLDRIRRAMGRVSRNMMMTGSPVYVKTTLT